MEIRLVHADDWVGLYVDRKLKMQGHSFRDIDLLKACGIEAKQRWVDDEWICDLGQLPDSLSEVEWEVDSDWED